MKELVEPQIKSDGEHPWPFDASFPLAVQFLVQDRTGTRLNWHEYFEVLVVLAGEAMCQVKERVFPVRCGDLFCIGGRQHHRLWGVGPGRTRIAALSFLPQLIRDPDEQGESVEYLTPFYAQLHTKDFPYVVPAATGIPRDVLGLLRRIHRELPSGTSRARLTARTYLKMLLVTLLNHYAEYPASRAAFDRVAANIERLRPLFDFIDQNYSERITVKDSARLLHMSESHFMRFFRQVCGQPFGLYLTEFRIAKAQALLVSGELTAREVAHATGFCDQSYFGSVFRKTTGMTPGEYRAQALRQAGRFPLRPDGTAL